MIFCNVMNILREYRTAKRTERVLIINSDGRFMYYTNSSNGTIFFDCMDYYASYSNGITHGAFVSTGAYMGSVYVLCKELE